MAVIASQNWVTGIAAENPWPTKQIAASLRSYEQLDLLAGIDVFTMPPKVAVAGLEKLSGKFKSRTHENYPVSIFDPSNSPLIEKFWKVDSKILKFSERLASKVPATGQELIHIAHEEGCEEMFPFLTKEEKAVLSADGKIPVHSKWEKKMSEGKIAPDTLLSIAGLASFTSDQEKLDERIRSIIE
jgi:transaldolase